MNGRMMCTEIVRTIRKFALFILFLNFCGGTSPAQLVWQPLSTVPSQHNLNGACFLDAETGYVVGSMGELFKTTDGGVSWRKQDGIQHSLPLNDVCFLSAKKGVVTNDLGSIFRTTDGGAHWLDHYGLTNARIHAVDFADSLVGVAVTSDGEILRTTDCGITWYMLPELTRVHLYDISFFDDQHGIIVGANRTILLSTDAGATWEIRQQSSCGARYTAVSAIPDGVAFIVGDGGDVLHTTNRGIDWSSQTSGTGTGLFSVFCTDADHAYAVGMGGTLIYTSDGGARWERGTSGVLSNLHAIFFTDSSTGVIVGGSGTFIRTKRDQTTRIEQTSAAHAATYMESVHPNPVRTQSSVSIVVESADYVQLHVYDLFGRQVATLIETVLPPGTHSFPWLVRELNPGMYIITLQSGRNIETRKILLQPQGGR